MCFAARKRRCLLVLVERSVPLNRDGVVRTLIDHATAPSMMASNDTRTDGAMIMTWGVGRSDAKDGNLEEKILRRADWGMIGQAAAV